MPTVGMLLFLAGLVVAVAGLIRPSLFARKAATPPKRLKLFLGGLGGAIIGFVMFGVTYEPPGSSTSPETSPPTVAEGATPSPVAEQADPVPDTMPEPPVASVSQTQRAKPDTDAAVDALTLAHIQYTQKHGGSSATRCTTEIVLGRHFVGCYAHSIGSRGNTALFLINRSSGGETTISPVNGTAMTLVRGQTSIAQVRGGSLKIERHQGPSIDIPAVLKHFD